MNLNYKYAESTVKPSEFEICKTTVYIRKDITLVGSFWTYQEATLSLDEYDVFKHSSEFKNTESILEIEKRQNTVEDNQMIIMEAIADLYDKISNIQGVNL